MIKSNTYIVCNSALVSKLQTIKHFKLNLGQALIDRQMNFNPADTIIQKHYLFHNKVIQLCGYIGSLAIYTSPSATFDILALYNDKDYLDYAIDSNMSFYDNINLGLDIFFTKMGIKSNVVTKTEEMPTPPEYVKPNKSFKDMTEYERIQYARNLK